MVSQDLEPLKWRPVYIILDALKEIGWMMVFSSMQPTRMKNELHMTRELPFHLDKKSYRAFSWCPVSVRDLLLFWYNRDIVWKLIYGKNNIVVFAHSRMVLYMFRLFRIQVRLRSRKECSVTFWFYNECKWNSIFEGVLKYVCRFEYCFFIVSGKKFWNMFWYCM